MGTLKLMRIGRELKFANKCGKLKHSGLKMGFQDRGEMASRHLLPRPPAAKWKFLENSIGMKKMGFEMKKITMQDGFRSRHLLPRPAAAEWKFLEPAFWDFFFPWRPISSHT